MDSYASFAVLSRCEVEGRDYRVHVRYGTTGIAIVAPHGGKIERGTMGLADAIAGTEHSFYCFEGIKPTVADNRILHVSSNRFDEPRALELVSDSHRVITIHGARGKEPAAYAGGLDLQLRQAVIAALNDSGFYADHDPSPTRQGRKPSNICNRGRNRRGLQLELTYGLRGQLFGPADDAGVRQPTGLFHRFVGTVRAVLWEYRR